MNLMHCRAAHRSCQAAPSSQGHRQGDCQRGRGRYRDRLAPELTPGEDIAPERGEKTVALGGALVSLARGHRRLLLQHPGFRAWATGAAKGHAGIGALLGIALTSAPAVNDAIQAFVAQFDGEDEAPAQPNAIPHHAWGTAAVLAR